MPKQEVGAIAFAPNDTALVTGDFDGNVFSWNLTTHVRQTLGRRHGNRVYSVAFSRDGAHMVTASRDMTVRYWDLAHCAAPGDSCFRTFAQPDWVMAADIDPTGEWLVTGGRDGIIRVIATGEMRQVLRILGHTGTVYSVRWDESTRHIVSGSADGRIGIWESPFDSAVAVSVSTSNPRRIATAAGERTSRYAGLEGLLTPDGHWAIAPSGDSLLVWSLFGPPSLAPLRRLVASVESGMTPDKHWFSRLEGGTLTIWRCSRCADSDSTLLNAASLRSGSATRPTK
jgi:WD40 repeat protein